MSGLLSGAPALLNPVLGAIGSTPLLEASDALGLNSQSLLGQWSIVSQSTPAGFGSALSSLAGGNIGGAISGAVSALTGGSQSVITFDSVVSFGFEQEYAISDYPIEAGNFQSYNKVMRPATIKMTLAIGNNFTVGNIISAVTSGSIDGAFSALTGGSARSSFLSQIAKALSSLSLLNIMTPDMTYSGYNVIHVDYDRKAAAGAKLLQVDVWFEQVITTATPTLANPASPTSADPVTSGTLSSVLPTASQALGAAERLV
jgi:hypothetical protein